MKFSGVPGNPIGHGRYELRVRTRESDLDSRIHELCLGSGRKPTERDSPPVGMRVGKSVELNRRDRRRHKKGEPTPSSSNENTKALFHTLWKRA